MSKKVIMILVAVLFGMQAGLAMAVNPDTGPGCGLGKSPGRLYEPEEHRTASDDGHDQWDWHEYICHQFRDIRLHKRWEVMAEHKVRFRCGQFRQPISGNGAGARRTPVFIGNSHGCACQP